jgi:hypothetical protein
MPHIRSRDPLRASIPPPDLPGVKFGTDSLARIPVAWTQPQPTTSTDTGYKVDPVNDARSGTTQYGATGTVSYGATEHPDGPGNTPNPYTPGATQPNIIASDDRLPFVIGNQTNPKFGGQAISPTSEATSTAPSTGPGTGRLFNPKMAQMGQSTTIVSGFGNQTPSGSGLRDQQQGTPLYNPEIDARKVYGKVWKSRIGQR